MLLLPTHMRFHSGVCSGMRDHLGIKGVTSLTSETKKIRLYKSQHMSAYVSIRQHTSAYVSIRQHTSAYVSIRQHTSAFVSSVGVFSQHAQL
jgi:hypothetical protein